MSREHQPELADKRLILKSPGFTNGRLELIPKQLPLVIGRGTEADIIINDGLLSRRHSEIRMNAVDLFEICDLDSMNLTIVNKHDVTSHVLQTGDEILLGETEFLVEVVLPSDGINDQTTRDFTMVPKKNDG